MKKTVLLLSSILVSVPTFAYGYGSDLDDSITWIGGLFFVWGVLEIILFFKIWGATNDIDKLKSAICDGKKGNDMSSYLKKMYLLGKEDEAYDYLNEAFCDEVVKICIECLNKAVPDLARVDFSEKLKSVRERYTKHYQSIRKEMPQRFYDIELRDLVEIR